MVQLAYNTSIHSAHKRTPSEICFGRTVNTPLALVAQAFTRQTVPGSDFLAQRAKLVEEVHAALVHRGEAIAKTVGKSRRAAVHYEVGGQVDVRVTTILGQRRGANHRITEGQKWDGPFTIVRTIPHPDGNGICNLVLDFEAEGYSGQKTTTVNVIDCRPYVRSCIREEGDTDRPSPQPEVVRGGGAADDHAAGGHRGADGAEGTGQSDGTGLADGHTRSGDGPRTHRRTGRRDGSGDAGGGDAATAGSRGGGGALRQEELETGQNVSQEGVEYSGARIRLPKGGEMLRASRGRSARVMEIFIGVAARIERD